MYLSGNAALPSAFQVDINWTKADVQSLLQKVAAHFKESEEEKKKREAEELRQQQERKELDAKVVAAKKAEEDLMRQLSAANHKLREKDAEIERRKQAESALRPSHLSVPISAASSSGGGSLSPREVEGLVKQMLQTHFGASNEGLLKRLRQLEQSSSQQQTAMDKKISDALTVQQSALSSKHEALKQELQKMVADGSSKAEIDEIKTKIAEIEGEQEQLKAVNIDKLTRVEMCNKYGNEPRVWQFYNIVLLLLEELILAAKAAASGVVDHSVEGKLGKAGGFISMLGQVVSMVPVVDVAGTWVQKAGDAVTYVDHERQQNMLKRVARLGTLTEIQQLVGAIAKELTERYYNQLMLLPTMEERNAELGIVQAPPVKGAAAPVKAAPKAAPKAPQGAVPPKVPPPKLSLWERGKKFVQRVTEKVEEVVLDEYPVTASTALGEFVVAIIWDKLQESSVPGLQPKSAADALRLLKADLLKAVERPSAVAPSSVLSGLQQLLTRASKYEVKATNGKLWQFEGILRRSGIRTPSGTFYDGGGAGKLGFMQVEVYNYCNGSDAEVAERGLVACSVAAAGVGPKAPAKGAGTKYVAQVQNKQSQIDSKVELLEKQNKQKEAEMEKMRKQLEELAKAQQNNSNSSVAPEDEIMIKARKSFSAFDIDGSGTLDEEEFVSCWSELIILDDKFGPEQSEDDLRECFRLLTGGSNKLSREAFVAFYTKVFFCCSFKNGLADLVFCRLTLTRWQRRCFWRRRRLTVRSPQRRQEW